mmetsp:Transcript_10494/g.24670  ORF Transcript_10494/g.24670 Transcript_10494/m.24670 type:complete len:119 (+) Transcript_10494:464-820(+)
MLAGIVARTAVVEHTRSPVPSNIAQQTLYWQQTPSISSSSPKPSPPSKSPPLEERRCRGQTPESLRCVLDKVLATVWRGAIHQATFETAHHSQPHTHTENVGKRSPANDASKVKCPEA